MSYQHCNSQHDLREIARSYGGAPGVERVVRWCRNCGSVVIDVDVDGRTRPGDVLPMQFPRIAQDYAASPRAAKPAPSGT